MPPWGDVKGVYPYTGEFHGNLYVLTYFVPTLHEFIPGEPEDNGEVLARQFLRRLHHLFGESEPTLEVSSILVFSLVGYGG